MNIDDNLSKLFDVEPIDNSKTEIITVEGEIISINSSAINYDYEATRANLHAILQQGQDALIHALSVAKQSEHPRAFEVVGGLMKHLSDINHQLLDLHKKKQVLDRPKDDESKEQTNVTNNSIFVGSTADLSKMLDDIRKNK